MLKQLITVQVQSTVAGPKGYKLRAGKVYELEDSPYTRVLIKSGTVSLIDPPSLDPEFLERAGYELREGFSYPEKLEPEESAPEAPPPEEPEPEELEPLAPEESFVGVQAEEPPNDELVGMLAEKTVIKAPYALTTSPKKEKAPKE